MMMMMMMMMMMITMITMIPMRGHPHGHLVEKLWGTKQH